jgi:hypothetical protein
LAMMTINDKRGSGVKNAKKLMMSYVNDPSFGEIIVK